MLADQLRQTRERAGYALAQQSGMGGATIADIVSGRHTHAGIVTMTNLADVLHSSLDTLAARPRLASRRPRRQPEGAARTAVGEGTADGDHDLGSL